MIPIVFADAETAAFVEIIRAPTHIAEWVQVQSLPPHSTQRRTRWELEPEDIREHLECGLLSESLARTESANYWWSSSRGASGTRWSLSGPVTVFLTKSVIIIVRRLSSGVWGLYGVAMGADGQDGMAMGWWSLVTVQ